MRITSQSQAVAIRADLATAGRRLADVQREISSGRQIERPSDGPSEALEALRYRRSLRGHDQYARNTIDAKGWLSQADTALDDVDDRLTRARALTIQAENGSLGPDARAAIATELRALADELVGLANTDHMGRPIFSGTAGGAQAFAQDGTYLGDSGVVTRRIDGNTTYQVNAVGTDVFGVQDLADPMNGNVFQVLRAVADDVEAGSNPAAGLDAIDTARDRISTAQATLGTRLGAIERLESRNLGVVFDTKSALSQVEDVDLTEAILELRTSEAAYTTALNVSARVLDNSLLDFLR